jgi:hypothetical protein
MKAIPSCREMWFNNMMKIFMLVSLLKFNKHLIQVNATEGKIKVKVKVNLEQATKAQRGVNVQLYFFKTGH